MSVLHAEVPDTLEGRVECNEVELPVNQKGERNLDCKAKRRSIDFIRNTEDKAKTTVQIVSAIDQNNQLYFKAVETNRLTAKHLKNPLENKTIRMQH